MAGAQHTPGPWEVGLDDQTMGVPFIQVETDTRAICEVSATHDEEDDEFDLLDEDRANARLIAAAPDLLAVARTVEWSAEIDMEEGGREDACPRCGSSKREGHGAYCSLAAAIAKAEGR